jgi:hypothetical protein
MFAMLKSCAWLTWLTMILLCSVGMLQARKPNAPNDWVKKVPDMARRLEHALYCIALSAEEHGNVDTLRNRLEQLAIRLAARGVHQKKPQQLQDDGERRIELADEKRRGAERETENEGSSKEDGGSMEEASTAQLHW